MIYDMINTLNLEHRNRHWEDRAGWRWEWDGEVKQWGGYYNGKFQGFVSEHVLNAHNDGVGFGPFMEIEEI